MGELQDAFQNYFGAEWAEALDTADPSFAYITGDSAYFAVRNLHPVKDLTLDRLTGKEGIGKPPNIIVS